MAVSMFSQRKKQFSKFLQTEEVDFGFMDRRNHV